MEDWTEAMRWDGAGEPERIVGIPGRHPGSQLLTPCPLTQAVDREERNRK